MANFLEDLLRGDPKTNPTPIEYGTIPQGQEGQFEDIGTLNEPMFRARTRGINGPPPINTGIQEGIIPDVSSLTPNDPGAGGPPPLPAAPGNIDPEATADPLEPFGGAGRDINTGPPPLGTPITPEAAAQGPYIPEDIDQGGGTGGESRYLNTFTDDDALGYVGDKELGSELEHGGARNIMGLISMLLGIPAAGAGAVATGVRGSAQGVSPLMQWLRTALGAGNARAPIAGQRMLGKPIGQGGPVNAPSVIRGGPPAPAPAATAARPPVGRVGGHGRGGGPGGFSGQSPYDAMVGGA